MKKNDALFILKNKLFSLVLAAPLFVAVSCSEKETVTPTPVANHSSTVNPGTARAIDSLLDQFAGSVVGSGYGSTSTTVSLRLTLSYKPGGRAISKTPVFEVNPGVSTVVPRFNNYPPSSTRLYFLNVYENGQLKSSLKVYI